MPPNFQIAAPILEPFVRYFKDVACFFFRLVFRKLQGYPLEAILAIRVSLGAGWRLVGAFTLSHISSLNI